LIVGRKGSAGIVHFSRVPFCPIDTTFFISPTDTTVDLEFLFYLLLHVDLRRILGDVGVPGLNREVAYKEPASLPRSKDEQQKIAGVLGLVQRAMEQQERLIEKTAELKKTLLHQLFTQGTRGEPQKQTDFGPIPESWEVMRVGRFGKAVTGSTPSTKNPEYYGGTYRLVSPADLDAGKYVVSSHRTLTEAGFAECRALPKDSVLVGCIGNIGKIGMAPDERCATNQQINSVICSKEFNPHFLYYCLQFHRPRLEQAAARVTLPILNKSNFENFLVAAPEKADQDEVAKVLSAVDEKTAHHRRKYATLSALFRTLLHQLMTAQLRVHDLELDGILEQAVQETDAP
jgi:type I restriction enzyme S subunit